MFNVTAYISVVLNTFGSLDSFENVIKDTDILPRKRT